MAALVDSGMGNKRISVRASLHLTLESDRDAQVSVTVTRRDTEHSILVSFYAKKKLMYRAWSCQGITLSMGNIPREILDVFTW